jgi:hypothetical protein
VGAARLGAGILVALAAWATPPSKFTCASCHKQEAQSQPRTSKGRATQLPADQTILETHPKLTFARNGYSYSIERKDGLSTYIVTDGTDSLSLPIEHAMGNYMQTFVFAYQGHFYESMVSYYPSLDGLAITLGSERLRPHNLVEAMGRETSTEEIVACYGCHTTKGASHGKLTLDSMEPGLTCEHCHTGADAHMEALAQGKPGVTPKRLGDMAAEEMSNFCGQCHRTWEAVIQMRAWGPKNVRFQPYRLANSKCFLGDDKRIRCTACHDPHGELVREASGYDRACLACHSRGAAAKSCPTAESKCASCHMPKIEQAEGHALFTDHQIRIVRPGEPYPN